MAFTIARSVGASAAAATGRSTQGHLRWAINQGAYWCFYPTSTQALSARYSTDGGGTWTTPTGSPFTLAHAHTSEGRNFGFQVLNIASTDVLHMAASYASTGGSSHARFTLGSTWTNTHAEAAISGFNAQSPSGMVSSTLSGDIPIDGGPVFGYGTTGSIHKADASDAGTSWSPSTFGGNFNAVITGHAPTSFGLFDTGSATMLMIADDNASATDSSTNLTNNLWSGGGWGTFSNVFASTFTAASNSQCWGACLRTGTDVHCVASTDGATTLAHRRWTGSAWTNGDTVPALTLGVNSGLSLITDGTFVWMAAVDTSKNVKYSKWTSGTGWGAWGTLATRTNAPTYITGAYSPARSELLWTWTEPNGGNYDIVGEAVSTSGAITPTGPFVDTLVGATAGVLAGRVSTSSYIWADLVDSVKTQHLTVDTIPSIANDPATTNDAFASVPGFTPASANYGFEAVVRYLSGTSNQIGPGVRCGLSGGILIGYFFAIDTDGSTYMLMKLSTTRLGPTVNIAHTFTPPLTTRLVLTATDDGSGNVDLVGYADGVQVITAHDDGNFGGNTSGGPPILTAGTVGLRAYNISVSPTTGAHVLSCRTDYTLTPPATTGAASILMGM